MFVRLRAGRRASENDGGCGSTGLPTRAWPVLPWCFTRTTPAGTDGAPRRVVHENRTQQCTSGFSVETPEEEKTFPGSTRRGECKWFDGTLAASFVGTASCNSRGALQSVPSQRENKSNSRWSFGLCSCRSFYCYAINTNRALSHSPIHFASSYVLSSSFSL